jgi:hypothetical protein
VITSEDVEVQGQCLEPTGYLADFALTGIAPGARIDQLPAVDGDEPDTVVGRAGWLRRTMPAPTAPGVVDAQPFIRNF